MLQGASTAVKSSLALPESSRFEQGERQVLACIHCRLVQFRTRSSMCRRCHKPLDAEVRNLTSVDPAAMLAGPEAIDAYDSVKNLGMRVRGVRMERGFTQRVLARRMDVPRTDISKVERGRVVPSLSTLRRIAAGLDATVTDLLRPDSECRRADETARILDDPFLAAIAQVAGKLNAVHRALILLALDDAASGRRPNKNN
jgi:transcriptional regulator with XRE-family HTH domain